MIELSPDSERPSYNIYEEKSVEQVNQASGPPVAQTEATTAPRRVKVLLENVFLLAFCISACKELLVLILHYFKVFRDFFYSVFKILHSFLLIMTLCTQSIFLVKICRSLRSFIILTDFLLIINILLTFILTLKVAFRIGVMVLRA